MSMSLYSSSLTATYENMMANNVCEIIKTIDGCPLKQNTTMVLSEQIEVTVKFIVLEHLWLVNTHLFNLESQTAVIVLFYFSSSPFLEITIVMQLG